MALTPGAHLGRYEILAPLGSGGMGEVYLAEDTQLRRRVALKVLPPAQTDDEDATDRLVREARAAATLDHPGICTVYDVGEADGRTFIAMQYVEGETLAARMVRAPLDLPTLVAVARQVAEALAEAHAHGIVHRDIKPQNIMVSRNNQAKVLDFGLARAMPAGIGGQTTVATEGGLLVGTVPYMSPEQLRGEPVDHRSDVFSFGTVLYEALTGTHPFAHASAAETMSAILTRDPSVSDIPGPADLRRILQKCLEKPRERRYQATRDLVIDLENVRTGAASSAQESAARRSPSILRRPLAWVAGGMMAALVAAVAALYLSRAGPPPVASASDYLQITDFTDSATAPSLSPDGRMVAFIRGGSWFLTETGQIYVKLLPNGDAVRLTDDPRPKLGPVFTPDGTRVAYTVQEGAARTWSVWTVPILGGTPTRLLPNAAGLSWIDERHVLFSEVQQGSALHMGLVTSTQDRSDSRRVYLPEHERGMAHFSYLSPDRANVLVVQMGRTGDFERCRVVPFDGSSPGQQVGPQGECLSAAWSPDGRWMYFSAVVEGVSHLWRQRFPGGAPESITSGPATDEHGVAVAPDGRSLITSLGQRQSSIWLHDPTGDRPLSSEGLAFAPQLSPDGRRLYYLVRRSATSAVELTVQDLASGRSDRLLPDFPILDFEISRDEKAVAFTASGRAGEPEIWLSPLDRSAAPRNMVRAADRVTFGENGDLVFRSLEGHVNFVDRISADGKGRERLLATPVLDVAGSTPDGRSVILGMSKAGAESEVEVVVMPVHGGTARVLCSGGCFTQWPADRKWLYLSFGFPLLGSTRTIALPLSPGQFFPDFPADGDAATAWRKLPGAQVIEQSGMFPGKDPSTYLFTKIEERRNLFRIPLPQ